MNTLDLEIRELAAWDFDHPVDRGSIADKQLEEVACRARRCVILRGTHSTKSPVYEGVSEQLAAALFARKQIVAESGEFDGLVWKLAIVDIRRLIAFQRRIGVSQEGPSRISPALTREQLFDVALPIKYSGKSPFFEVAFYSGRWFLRDGYHRSFQLLNQGIYLVPVVVVFAKTLAEMGAIGNQFFGPEILFSDHPPMVTDFLDDEVTSCYRRAPGFLPIRVTIQPMPDFALSGCCEEQQ